MAWKALSLLTSPTDTAIAALGDDASDAIDAAVAKTDAEMTGVPERGERRAAWEAAIDERLRRLAAKVLPTASPDAAKAWRDAMVEALSDLPAMIALTAAKRAIHLPFRFIGEVEPGIREIATSMIDRRSARRAGLERLREALRRAALPQKALPAPGEISDDGIRAMSTEMRQLGLTGGFITQEQVARALAGAVSMREAA